MRAASLPERPPARDPAPFLHPALVLSAGRAAAFLASFSIPVVLARIFDPSLFGAYKQVFLLHSTLYLIFQLGLAESLFYFLPRAPRGGGACVGNAMALLAISGLAAGGLLVAGAGPLSAWLGNPDLHAWLPLLALFVFLTLPSTPLEIVLTARGRHAAAAAAYGISDVLKAICLLVPAMLTGDLGWLLAGAVAFAAIRLGATLAAFRGSSREGPRLDPSLARAHLAYTLPMAAYVLVESLQAGFHQYAVSSRFDAATFAVYAVGCLQIPLVELIASPACNVMMVGMGRSLHEGRTDSALALWRDTTARLAWIVLPAVGLLIVAGREVIVLLFTEQYAGSVPIFRLWCLSLLLAIPQADGVLRACAETRFLCLLGLLKLALIAGTIGWLLSLHGLRGGVIATLLAWVVAKGAALLRVGRLLGAPLRDLLPWRAITSAGALTALASVLALAVRGATAGAPVAVLAATCASYAAALGAFLLAARALARRREPVALGWSPR